MITLQDKSMVKPISPYTLKISINEIKEYMAKYKFYPQKKLGQNFLIDNNITDIILKALDLKKEESIFEIGTGLGSLTLPLIAFTEHVFTIEKDVRFKPILSDIFSQYSDFVTLISGDFLNFDIEEFLKQKKQEGHNIEKLVGNLPYSISFPLLNKILRMGKLFNIAVIMVQREVADRMLAKPGSKNYGLLSILSDYFAIAEKIHLVKPEAFFPEPKVESTIIKIYFLKNPKIEVIDEDLFLTIIKAIFQYRRKNLSNALKSYFKGCLNKNELEKSLKGIGINPKRRGDTLVLEEFPLLTKTIKRLIIC